MNALSSPAPARDDGNVTVLRLPWMRMAVVVTVLCGVAATSALSGLGWALSVDDVPESYVVAYDARSGKAQWRLRAGGHAVAATLAATSNDVAVVMFQACEPRRGQRAARLGAIDTSTGTWLWRDRRRAEGVAGPLPQPGDGPLVLVSIDEVIGVDPETGQDSWAVETGPVSGGVAVQRRHVLVTQRPGESPRTLNRNTGKPVGSVAPTTAPKTVRAGSTVVSDTYDYDGRGGGGLIGTDARTGTTLWTLDGAQLVAGLRPTSEDLLAWRSGKLVDLDPRSGELRWETDARGDVVSTADDAVLLVDDSDLRVLSLVDGTTAWQAAPFDETDQQLATITSAVYREGQILVTAGCDPNSP